MEIKRYEEWMRPQVIELFALEYGVDKEEFDQLFGTFYDHPFQRNHCVRIVSVEGERVAGFQSFFYWPLQRGGEILKALQSGNSLVHPDFRGQRLFARMLDFIHAPESGITFDLLIGFPVEASYNSFIRNKWLNPFNLQWYIRVMTPIRALIPGREARLSRIAAEHSPVQFTADSASVVVSRDSPFDQYRSSYQKGHYFRLGYSEGDRHAYFELKPSVRKKVIHELIIGKAVFSHADSQWMQRSLSLLIKDVRRSGGYSMLSIAVNSLNPLWPMLLKGSRFSMIRRHIYFIAKGPDAERVTDWSTWQIFRGDIDTW